MGKGMDMIDRRGLIVGGALLALTGTASAQSRRKVFAPAPPWPPREVAMLWPGPPPGAPAGTPRSAVPVPQPLGTVQRWERGIRYPHIGIFRPARPDGRAVLAIPGGGYGYVSLINEGVNLARALNPAGITVFVLAYRLPGEGWTNRSDVPLQDAQRAMRLIRARAAALRIDPERLGICGFSAGGHLAGVLSVGHADPVYSPVDTADRLSARPAYAGLIYPVTNPRTAGPASRSAPNLFGDSPTPAMLARHDVLARVDAATPPLFLVHAMDDPIVPVTQSLSLIEVARRARVPIEAHLPEHGGHGFGALGLPARNPDTGWTNWFAAWTATRGG
jgi:acetyl esterase/lipase